MLTDIATVPAVIAVMTLFKSLGMPTKFGALVAAVIGIAFQFLSELSMHTQFTPSNVAEYISTGLLLGLSASGLYDASKLMGGTTTTITADELRQMDVSTAAKVLAQASKDKKANA